MIKPTPEQVTEYAKEIGCPAIDGEEFCDFYEMRGWMIAPKFPMQSWKATVRTWKRKREKWRSEDADKMPTCDTDPSEIEKLRNMGCA